LNHAWKVSFLEDSYGYRPNKSALDDGCNYSASYIKFLIKFSYFLQVSHITSGKSCGKVVNMLNYVKNIDNICEWVYHIFVDYFLCILVFLNFVPHLNVKKLTD